VNEHNLEVIKTADWIIDLGLEGGDGGGEIVAAGTPEDIVREKRSYTGAFLKPVLARSGGSAGRRRKELRRRSNKSRRLSDFYRSP
jgi:excinuclease ABC subunit A